MKEERTEEGRKIEREGGRMHGGKGRKKMNCILAQSLDIWPLYQGIHFIMMGRHGTCSLVLVINKEERTCDLSAFISSTLSNTPAHGIELLIFKVGLLTSIKHFLNSLTDMSERMFPS